MSLKVVLNYQEYADAETEKAVLARLGDVGIVESRTRDPAEFIPLVRDADGAIIQYVKVNAGVIGAMERARVIVRYGIAYDNIDVAAARARGITVCHVPSYCLDEVSNHALALILALERKLFQADRWLRAGEYQQERLRPIERLSGCRVGLVGFGSIARELARKLLPLVREIWAYDPLVEKSLFARHSCQEKTLPEIFSACDFVSLHVPINEGTRRMVGPELIARMKPGAFLINTSRGGVVDEGALVAALEEHRIAGAGLDVFEVEPLPRTSPLLGMENVILSGHVGWYSEGAIRELKETAAEEVVRVLSGQAPRHPVP